MDFWNSNISQHWIFSNSTTHRKTRQTIIECWIFSSVHRSFWHFRKISRFQKNTEFAGAWAVRFAKKWWLLSTRTDSSSARYPVICSVATRAKSISSARLVAKSAENITNKSDCIRHYQVDRLWHRYHLQNTLRTDEVRGFQSRAGSSCCLGWVGLLRWWTSHPLIASISMEVRIFAETSSPDPRKLPLSTLGQPLQARALKLSKWKFMRTLSKILCCQLVLPFCAQPF